MDISSTAMIHYRNMQIPNNKTSPPKNDKELMDACKDFEAILIKQMLDSMRKTVPDSGLLDEGPGKEIFEDMLYDEYANKMAETANLGISKMLYKQLSNYNNTNVKVY